MDIIIFDKVIKEAYLTDVAIPNSQIFTHHHREAPKVYKLESG